MQESTIFEALVGWMRANPDNSHLFGKFLEYIDLYLLEEEQWDILFKPTHLVDPTFFQNLLNQQREQAKKVQKIENRNVINGIKDVRIVDGMVINLVFLNHTTVVQPVDEKDNFIVDLKQKFLLNCLKLKCKNDKAYTVAVSTDMRDWECVEGHSKNESGLQVLHFGDRVVRFFRIEPVNKDVWFYTRINIEALYLPTSSEIANQGTLCGTAGGSGQDVGNLQAKVMETSNP
uniref:BACK domain-containing protein n=1 Tax=Panagrellus redivivus TaxID=6233 RepID=A0A7E4VWA0_PANRE